MLAEDGIFKLAGVPQNGLFPSINIAPDESPMTDHTILLNNARSLDTSIGVDNRRLMDTDLVIQEIILMVGELFDLSLQECSKACQGYTNCPKNAAKAGSSVEIRRAMEIKGNWTFSGVSSSTWTKFPLVL